MSLRPCLLCAVALALLLLTPQARAGFVFFTINPANVNEVALVGEQILFNPNTSLFDYEFLVSNIGTVGINGFFGGIGNRAVAIAGGQWIGTAVGGADAANGFPASVLTGVGSPLITNAFGATNPFSPVPFNSWGFEEFDNRPVPPGGFALPATSYVVRWFNVGLTGPLPPGFFTRFDLISAFGPSPGGGGIDPPSSDPFFGFEDVFNSTPDLWTLDTASLNIPSCNTVTDTNCSSNTIPSQFSGAQAFGTPEPATWALLTAGLLAVAGIRRSIA